MNKIVQVAGKGIPVKGNDIDTDRIIPARFMKTITFNGLGKYAFYDARFDSKGKELNHPFNYSKFEGASVLVVNKNFGCGSSREHAPQALAKFGIKAIVGESFAEIFAGNCQMIGIVCVTAGKSDVDSLQKFIEQEQGAMINVNINQKKVSFGDTSIPINIPESWRITLVEGTWDTLGLLVDSLDKTKQLSEKIPYLNGFK